MANTLKFGNGEWYGKEGTILAYNSENNNYKPLPFTFDRDSVATRVNKQGLIETVGADQPRIDYLNNTKGHLLLEPSRTNSLLQSNQFNTTWITNTATIEGGKVGVGNSNDAWLLSRTGTNGRIYQTSTSSGTQTLSIYAKSNTNNWLFLVIGGSETAYYDLENGVVGTTSSSNIAKIEPIGNNGWYRCSITFTHTNPQVRIQPALDNNNVTGSGSIYIQNSQLEQGSYATSYIPTQGSAVTRLADVCSQTVPDGVIGQTEGTIFAEIDYTPHSINYEMIASLKGTSTNQYIEFYFESNNRLGFGIYNGAVVQMSFTSAVQTKGIKKIAIAYKSNDFAIYLNGTQLHTDNSGSVPLLSSLGLGNNIALSNYQLSQPIKQFQLYNTRLSNSELAALTQV